MQRGTLWVTYLVGALALACLAEAQQQREPGAAAHPVHYALSPILDQDHYSGVHVAMTFVVGADGKMLVRFPWRYADRDDLFANVSDIVLSGGELVDTERAPEKQVIARPSSTVTLSFTLRSGIAGEPTIADGQPFSPWIQKDWMFLDGASVFPRLALPADTPATFVWKGDKSTPFASDLARFRTAADGGATGDVTSGTILAGEEVRILDRGALKLAMHGSFPFADQAMLDGIAALLLELRKFWNDRQHEPYLVNLVSVPAGPGYRGGYGGTGHGPDAFAAVIAGDVRFRDLVGGLFAHEIMHGWIPGQLAVPATPDNAWFGEGFTEYYARLIPWRAGAVSLDDFIARWNEALVDYAVASARNWPHEKLAEAYWADKEAELIPYNKGAMLAALWNAELRRLSAHQTNLDDLMRQQRLQVSRSLNGQPGGSASPEGVFTSNVLKAGLDIAPDIAAYVLRGETVVLPPDTFGLCITVDSVKIASYDRGFDLEASIAANNVAKGVRVDGPAYAAGLRDGMRLLRPIEGRAGNSTVESAWLVEEDGRESTLRWKPAGAGEVSVQRLTRTKAEADPASCGL